MNHKLLLFLSAWLCVFIRAQAQSDDPDAFITTWQTDACTEADRWGLDIDEVYLDKIINLPIVQGERGTYDFTVDWGDGTQRHVTGSISTTVDTYIEVGVGYVLSEQDLDSDAFFKIEPSYVFGGIAHVYEDPGVYQVKITGSFPGIVFGGIGNPAKLLSVDQWGSNQWQTMEAAFVGCRNLSILATDAPDLSQVTSLANMFRGYFVTCQLEHSLNTMNIGHWDVSGVTNMFGMFYESPFNQDISGWDVSNVTKMYGMFARSPFNQDISSWDVSQVTNMSRMFYDSPFNQDISGWDVSQVTDMREMFRDSEFNQDISGWDVSQVTNMREMFRYSEFNRDISGWDVSQVTNMQRMFYNSPFNQDISGWDVSNVTDMYRMFDGSSLSTANYDALLQGWAQQEVQNGVRFSVNPYIWGTSGTYCNGQAARNKLINEHGWVIQDGGRDCAIPAEEADDFVTTWQTDACVDIADPEFTGDLHQRVINIPIMHNAAGSYDFIVDWGDGTRRHVTSSLSTKMFSGSVNGKIMLIADEDEGHSNIPDNPDWITKEHDLVGIAHAYELPGTYQVSIIGSFPGIRFANDHEMSYASKLISIDQWGSNQWQSMEYAFNRCYNLNVTAQDAPDLSQITSLAGMFIDNSGDFGECIALPATQRQLNLGHWDIITITNFTNMFQYSTLSSADYDALLQGWAQQEVQDGVHFSVDWSVTYCDGQAARNKLINEHGWVIQDGGRECFVAEIALVGADQLYTGLTMQLSTTVSPTDVRDTTVTYSVDDPSVATIDPTTGILTAIALGVVTVTAKANDGSGVTATKQVTVLKRIVLDYELATASSYSLQSYSDAVSSTDLLTGITPITTGWNYTNHASSLELTDGSHGEGFQFYPADWVQGAWTTTGATAIYDLGIGANGQGYDLTSIVSIADWEGAGFGNQAWTMEVLPVGGSSYELLATVDYQPFTATQGGSTKVTIANNGEAVASGIQKIKITARQVNDGNRAGGFVWRELDVFGQPTGSVETASTSRIGSGANTLAHVTSPFKAYPTTTRHALYFEINDFQIDEHVIKVTALDGKSWNMQPTKVEADAETRKVTVDVAALKTGVYLLQVHTEGRVLSTRFVKQ